MRTVFVILLLGFVVNASALPNYTGRSGAPGRNTCASSCHGGPVVNTVQIIGFPATYTPGQSYLLTIRKMSGGTIVNFNASCRIGESGTENAGVITSGQLTSTYNVSGETNGVHFTTMNHDSGQFTWTAPAAGTGLVKLYAGALQTDIDGANSTIVLTANEFVAAPPGIPQHLTALVENDGIRLNWDASLNAVLYNVYRDTLEIVDPTPANLIGMTPIPTYLDITPVPLKANYVVTAQ